MFCGLAARLAVGWAEGDGWVRSEIGTGLLQWRHVVSLVQPDCKWANRSRMFREQGLIVAVTEDQGPTLALLADPGSYGLAAGEAVTRVDTHASHIFLAGDRVYKMKRALRYPYLDYGTAGRRKWACEREVALNRRTAPSLYLGVAAVRRDPGGRLFLDPHGARVGEPVDWLVVMRRFDAGDLLDDRARKGLLTPELMRRAAAAIATFHRDAEVAPDGAGSEAMRAVIAENFEELRSQPELFDLATVEELEARSGNAFAATAGLIDRRREAGLVRQCHGDLHLRNICLVEGEPTLFDCIEFNDAFARIDVLYDLAFLLMDLIHREHTDLANVVGNEYAKDGRNLDGLALLPLFMATRATVRAKVAGSAMAVGGAAKAAGAVEIAAYLDLARRLLTWSPPLVVAIGGLPGTGKTTVARSIAPSLGGVVGALHWRSDVIRKQLAEVDELTRLPPVTYTREASDRVYGEMLRRAGETLAAGHPVVLDATFMAAEERDAVEAMARSAGAAFEGFWLEAPEGELRRRLAGRTGDASDATPAVLDKMAAYRTGTVGWTRLDAAAPEPGGRILRHLGLRRV